MRKRSPFGVLHDRGTHRRQHALLRADRVAFALYEAELVRGAGLRGEVVHRVVQEEPRALHDHLATVPGVDAGRDRHGVALIVHHRVVGGVALVQECIDPGMPPRRRAWRAPAKSSPRGCPRTRPRGTASTGSSTKSGSARYSLRSAKARRKDSAMTWIDSGRVPSHSAQVPPLDDVGDRGHGDAARRWGRHRVHRVAAVVEGGGLAPHRGVAVEVLQGDDAPAALHLRRDEGGGLAAIEVVGALVTEPGEDGGEVGLRRRRRRPRGPRRRAGTPAALDGEGADAVLRGFQRGDEARP